MKKIDELKQNPIADTEKIGDNESYEWYLLAKKHFEFYTFNDPARRQQMTDAIADYEKRHAIK